ncbi:MAG: hypothetical protein ACNS60_01740 [Candidatus Cyclobacteriaceae bacterium M2_1C_046]
MSKISSTSKKWLVAFIVILVILFIYRLTKVPEQEELPEQVEEIDWSNIDKIEFHGKDGVQIVKETDQYRVLQEDTTYTIQPEKVQNLFNAFNKFQRADLKPVDFEEWIKTKPDTSYYLLMLYKNTEEVLNLYITPGDKNTYFRYLDSRNIYQTSRLPDEQFRWLKSLMETKD